MTKNEIFDSIKNSNYAKKLDLKFFNDDHIVYTLNNSVYEIDIYSNYNKISFVCSKGDVKKMRVGMYIDMLTSDKVVLRFGQIIRLIKKTDKFLIKKQKDSVIIKKAITKYIEKSFDCNDASISINFQKTKVYTRRSVKNIPFDPLNGDLLNPVYDINVRFSNDYDVYYYLTLLYDKKLFLLSVKERFQKGKNVTGIIRSEKLKSLF